MLAPSFICNFIKINEWTRYITCILVQESISFFVTPRASVSVITRVF